MNNDENSKQNAEPGWVFHPETGKIEQNTPPLAPSVQTPISSTIPNVDEPALITEVQAPTQVLNSDSSVAWTASEFIDHSKNFSWYALLLAGTIVLGGAIYFITKDIFSVSVIIFFAGVFGFVAGRKPKVLTFSVSEEGINIGEKGYSYSLFKSFSVMEEIAIDSVVLSPLKRFMPPITMYLAPDDKDKIIEVLSHYLPHEEKNHDSVEKLMQKIRF